MGASSSVGDEIDDEGYACAVEISFTQHAQKPEDGRHPGLMLSYVVCARDGKTATCPYTREHHSGVRNVPNERPGLNDEISFLQHGVCNKSAMWEHINAGGYTVGCLAVECPNFKRLQAPSTDADPAGTANDDISSFKFFVETP